MKKKFKFDWGRIKRTAIQSGVSSAIVFITAILTDMSYEVLISSSITFVGTVLLAILMNMQTQIEESKENVELTDTVDNSETESNDEEDLS